MLTKIRDLNIELAKKRNQIKFFYVSVCLFPIFLLSLWASQPEINELINWLIIRVYSRCPSFQIILTKRESPKISSLIEMLADNVCVYAYMHAITRCHYGIGWYVQHVAWLAPFDLTQAADVTRPWNALSLNTDSSLHVPCCVRQHLPVQLPEVLHSRDQRDHRLATKYSCWSLCPMKIPQGAPRQNCRGQTSDVSVTLE